MVQRVLYGLKRQYGGTVDIYTMTSGSVDLATGVATTVKNVVRVDRAIVLPARLSREVTQSISVISANKSLVMGGTYDSRKRLFIVDRRDAPGLTLTKDSWLVYRGEKYAIEEVEEAEFESSWIITGKQLVGEVPEQILLLGADNLLTLESEATNGS